MKLVPLLAFVAATGVACSAEKEVRDVFVTEAALVLAGQRGVEVKVVTSRRGDAAWEVRWFDAAGKEVRERAVAGSGEGAAFFRSVFQQLAGDDWRPAGASPDNARAAFWQGAELAAASRDDALAAIAKLLAEKPRAERAADAARLAGAYVQAAAPSAAGERALDPVLLARGAAWLALAEARLREPIDSAWAPVLHLSGREAEAAEWWKTTASKKPRTAAEKAWSLKLGGSPEETAPTSAPDFTDADKAWAYLRSLEQPPRNSDSPDDQLRRTRLWLKERRDAAEKFRAAFPGDPRRWDAAIIAYESTNHFARVGEREAKPMAPEVLDAILAAPDASAETKGDAAFLRALLAGDGVTPYSPHTMPPFHRALSEFIAAYPQHPRAPVAANIQLQLLDAAETAGTDNLLAKLAAHPNPQIVGQAKARLEQRTRIAELRKQPLDLKFTAADGREVDAAALRGKVVLLDFWASWCGPCIADAPHVVAAFQKLHDRGFEIVGISLDDDKAAMEAAAKRAGMTWPQHFDGKGWQNEIAQRFGIRSIPSTWLFDKQGRLRETGLRGQELEARIENLLRE